MSDPRLNKTHSMTKQIADCYDKLRSLGDARRSVWQDLSNEGYSHREIAEAAGVSEHTVYRELRKLREERRNWEKPLKQKSEDLEQIT